MYIYCKIVTELSILALIRSMKAQWRCGLKMSYILQGQWVDELEIVKKQLINCRLNDGERILLEDALL